MVLDAHIRKVYVPMTETGFYILLCLRTEMHGYSIVRRVEELTDGEAAFADPADRATAESDRSFTLRIRDRERRLIHKIQEAIKRMDDGVYGVCEECGEDIGVARLKARPVTTLCVSCKARQEEGEDVRGN